VIDSAKSTTTYYYTYGKYFTAQVKFLSPISFEFGWSC